MRVRRDDPAACARGQPAAADRAASRSASSAPTAAPPRQAALEGHQPAFVGRVPQRPLEELCQRPCVSTQLPDHIGRASPGRDDLARAVRAHEVELVVGSERAADGVGVGADQLHRVDVLERSDLGVLARLRLPAPVDAFDLVEDVVQVRPKLLEGPVDEADAVDHAQELAAFVVDHHEQDHAEEDALEQAAPRRPRAARRVAKHEPVRVRASARRVFQDAMALLVPRRTVGGGVPARLERDGVLEHRGVERCGLSLATSHGGELVGARGGSRPASAR